MGDNMCHTLINPNQLRHYDTKAQDNPMPKYSLSIIIEDNEFCMELDLADTIYYADTFTLSDKDLQRCPHIILTSPHPWDHHNVIFRKHKKFRL